jgi:hypothetical protein
MRCLVEGGIEGQKGTGILQAVTCKLEFIHGVNVLYGEFDAGTLWRFHDPHKEVSLLPCLQEDAIIA